GPGGRRRPCRRAAAVADRTPELLARRDLHRRDRPPRLRRDAPRGPPHGVHSAALLRGRLALGAGVRLARDGAQVALGPVRGGERSGGLRGGARAVLASRGPARRSSLRGQPVLRLVLAGGARLRDAGAAL